MHTWICTYTPAHIATYNKQYNIYFFTPMLWASWKDARQHVGPLMGAPAAPSVVLKTCGLHRPQKVSDGSRRDAPLQRKHVECCVPCLVSSVVVVCLCGMLCWVVLPCVVVQSKLYKWYRPDVWQRVRSIWFDVFPRFPTVFPHWRVGRPRS